MMIKKLILLLSVLPLAAQAQQANSPATEMNLTVEFTRSVSIGWGDKRTWSGAAQTEMAWRKGENGIEIFAGKSGAVLVDTRNFLNYQASAGTTTLTETLKESSTRGASGLESGQSWEATRTFADPPAYYCSNHDAKFDSKFEVGPAEPFSVKIDGKESSVMVLPVVERGWWNKCYSGRRYSRLLVAKELGIVVSIEHVGYTLQGQTHESSYRFDVKEIRTATPNKAS